jgi:predicted permease
VGNVSERPASGHSERAFRRLLALFPRDFRERFGDDMAELFRDQRRAARARGGTPALLALWSRTMSGVVRAAALEHHALLQQPARQSRSDGMLATLRTDLRFAARMLRKSPLFTAVAVLCIALGSGAVTTVFSALNAMVLRPLPGVDDATRLVRLERTHPGDDGSTSASYPYYEHLRDRARTVDGVAAWSKVSLTVRRGSEPATAIYGNFVSGNLFTVLGVRPALGRFFVPDEDRTELTHPVIVVSEGFWRTRLDADSGAVGQDLVVNGQRFTLVGVAPAAFQGLDAPIRTDAWVPIHMQRALRPGRDALASTSVTWLRLCARLAPGVTADAARRELVTLAAARAVDPAEPVELRTQNTLRVSRLSSLPPDASGTLGGFLALLLGAAALVLLIASVNVGAMLSARAVARRREMAVRSALGAARGRLVRQLLTELSLLFTLGAGGGVLLAIVATRALERLPIPADLPIDLELSPDPRVFAFALAVSLVTGLLVGLQPARRAARADLATRLRDGTAGSGTRRGLAGNALVVAQLAVSLLLLVGAGLFGRALQYGTRVDPGFDARGIATVPVNLDAWGHDSTRARTVVRELRDRLSAIPGVTAVSAATALPLTLHSSGDDIRVDGVELGRDGGLPIQTMKVDAGYLALLRIPLRSGREFVRGDDATAPRVAVVNETLARRLWPDGDALGRTFRLHGDRVTIVGVARDAKYSSLAERTPALAYFPVAQRWESRQTLLVRTPGDPRALAPAIAEAMRTVDPGLPRPIVLPLAEAMGLGLLPQRVAALVTGALGGVGLLLATVGLYGLVAYSASRRTREIGVRVALGARRTDVLRLIAGEGMRLTAAGVAVGLLLAAAATRLLASLLFGISPLDPLTYGATSAVFVLVALVASWLPARRAAGADPMVVLRGE